MSNGITWLFFFSWHLWTMTYLDFPLFLRFVSNGSYLDFPFMLKFVTNGITWISLFSWHLWAMASLRFSLFSWNLWAMASPGFPSFLDIYEQWHDTTNKISLRPVKTRISLSIRPVWLEFLLCTQWVHVTKNPCFLRADSEDWSGWGDVQSDPSLLMTYSHIVAV